MHAVDLVPTLYELLGIEPPDVLKGYTQSPIEGESFVASLADAAAPGRETQFYSMLGMRALYHQGWLANTLHPPISGWSNFDAGRVGALPPAPRTAPRSHNVARRAPRAARAS